MSKKLTDTVATLAGVGPKRAENLADLGIVTIGDLLEYYPFRYDDLQTKSFEEMADQEKVVLKGTVVSEPVVSHYGYRKNRLAFRLMVDHAVIMVTFFNQAFLKDRVEMGADLAVFGKWDAKRKSLSGMKLLAEKQADEDFAPIYHVSKQVRQGTLVKLIEEAFAQYGTVIEETLPPELCQRYAFLKRGQAMYALHFPKNPAENQAARRRVAFEEFFYFQLDMLLLRQKEQAGTVGTAILYDVAQLKNFISDLPFELTDAQKQVTNEICRDLRRPLHMHRLLQGDVGSGKTVVAALALYATVTAGYQGALMVPTEILAEQHAESLHGLFADTEVEIALLTGSTKTAERRQILADLAAGNINIIVGTHALIQNEVIYERLGLVITDEQHRFGVKQRQALREKGESANVLFMTATPIPRTLAITAYGEMDVSIINQMPAGRIPIQTRWVRPPQLESVLHWAKGELAKGRQMYVVCPLIEESEALDARNAQAFYHQLQAYFEPQYAVALLHGRMKPAEKEAIMTQFKANESQILVSTTVIEVGVNVPNATIMLVVDAERFGLAQLHQLRGRVGRGAHASTCILLSEPKNDMGKERMKIMTETTDGFVLSQKDLEMRGPGEFFGHRQSGVPQFKVANLVEDAELLEEARTEAAYIIADNWPVNSANAMVVARWAERAANRDYLD